MHDQHAVSIATARICPIWMHPPSPEKLSVLKVRAGKQGWADRNMLLHGGDHRWLSRNKRS